MKTHADSAATAATAATAVTPVTAMTATDEWGCQELAQTDGTRRTNTHDSNDDSNYQEIGKNASNDGNDRRIDLVDMTT
jgi:hypothetical protein